MSQQQTRTGVVNPPPTVVIAEIKAALIENQGKVGEVFRIDEKTPGLSEQDLVELGAGIDGPAVWQSRQSIRTMCTADLPTRTSYAKQVGHAIGGLMCRNKAFSSDTKEYLLELRAALDDISNSATVLAEEEAAVADAADTFEKSIEFQSGVYVYTLPMYFRHPITTEPDRWMFKVGVTGNSIIKRVLQQQRLTGLPEDPIVLRAYIPTVKPPSTVERSFHSLLIAAGGHPQAAGKVVGKEWYATSLTYLDAIAEVLDCEMFKAAT